MMRLLLLLASLIVYHTSISQTFTEVPPPYVFSGISNGSISVADVNMDGLSDVLVTGRNSFGTPISKLYANDGQGAYFEILGNQITNVYFSFSVFVDIDNDTDPDLVIMGFSSSGDRVTQLYLNDGIGNFTLKEDTPFERLFLGSIATADVDSDGFQDIFITGWNRENNYVAKLYHNDNNGEFSEMAGTTFTGTVLGTSNFADLNNDGYEDLIITGMDSLIKPTSKLYLNDGTGAFTESTSHAIEGVSVSAAAFSDVNGDNTIDIFVSGQDSSDQSISKLYLNDGNANFTEAHNILFEGVREGAVAIADVNNDGLKDIFLTGENDLENPVVRLYINNANSSFTEKRLPSVNAVTKGGMILSDINGDNSLDLFLTGIDSSRNTIFEVYFNDGQGKFAVRIGNRLEGIWLGSTTFSDLNNDGHPDLLITGQKSSLQRIAKLYFNNGTGYFNSVLDAPFEGVYQSSAAISDIDNDGDNDILITGQNSEGKSCADLYRNDGAGEFNRLGGLPFDSVRNGAVAFADIDFNGFKDVLITGLNSSNQRISKLYLNEGSGIFSEVQNTPFLGVDFGSIASADFNGDGYLDFLISGKSPQGIPTSNLYVNDGLGNFTEHTSSTLVGVSSGSVATSDINRDGNIDLLITGQIASGTLVAQLYTNDGTGVLSEIIPSPFEGLGESSVAFADINNDGYPDLFMTGVTSEGKPSSKLYVNDRSGSFTESTATLFENVWLSSVGLSDINGDTHIDILLAGQTESASHIAKLYFNDGNASTVFETKTEDHFGIHIYPNPTTGSNLSVILEEQGQKEISLRVYNLKGQTLIQQNLKDMIVDDYALSIDISMLASGIHFLEVSSGKKSETIKFTVN